MALQVSGHLDFSGKCRRVSQQKPPRENSERLRSLQYHISALTSICTHMDTGLAVCYEPDAQLLQSTAAPLSQWSRADLPLLRVCPFLVLVTSHVQHLVLCDGSTAGAGCSWVRTLEKTWSPRHKQFYWSREPETQISSWDWAATCWYLAWKIKCDQLR